MDLVYSTRLNSQVKLEGSGGGAGSQRYISCLNVPEKEGHEKTDIYRSPDRIAGMGTTEIGAQERDDPCRSLRADWPDGGSRTGLFVEVR